MWATSGLIILTAGYCQHWLDFLPIEAVTQDCLLVKAGQVHAFNINHEWDGWLIIFKPEKLYLNHEHSTLGNQNDIFSALPTRLSLQEQEYSVLLDGIRLLRHDIEHYGTQTTGRLLSSTLLHYLLLHLHLVVQQSQTPENFNPLMSKRFQRFQQLVEKHFTQHHHVHDYAAHLGCSEKSLNRVVQILSGVTAKQYLVQRITLQAKRLVVHTPLPIGTIGLDLGFNEATNFVKFFKREVGMLPKAFWEQYW